MGNDFRKAENQERLIAKAIADTMPELIAAMDEDALAALFFSLERLATAPNRRRIAKHPLRPEIVDEMHAGRTRRRPAPRRKPRRRRRKPKPGRK